MVEYAIKKVPWKKITAPMLPLLIADYFLGKFLIKVYTINVTHGILDRFPTDRTFYSFLIVNFLIMSVYLFVSANGHINQEKLNNLRVIMELSPAKEL